MQKNKVKNKKPMFCNKFFTYLYPLKLHCFTRGAFNYSLTYYDIGTKVCNCFAWHEGVSRKNFSSFVFRWMLNKNSVIAAILVLMVPRPKQGRFCT